MKNYKLELSGNTKLTGTVKISGAKNAALPVMASTILSGGDCILKNVPEVNDVKIMFETFLYLGANGAFESNSLKINFNNLSHFYIDQELAEKTRASILLLGPILSRFGQVHIAMPGGCSIGERKINFHLQGLSLMGADITQKNKYISASSKRLKGIDYKFPFKTVTGTENLVMGAVLASGKSVLRNCALEPEIDDLIKMLKAMGSSISKNGDIIEITGTKELDGTLHTVMPDRIETGTFMIAGALGDNEICIQNCIPGHNDFLISVLKKMGVSISTDNNQIIIKAPKKLMPVNIETNPYPEFPTDLQALITTLLTQAHGKSTITENIFDNRFQHIHELNKMGAKIHSEGNQIFIDGKTDLTGNKLRATDLRSSAALVLAATIALGPTTITNANQLFRGYENISQKLDQLGTSINISGSDL